MPVNLVGLPPDPVLPISFTKTVPAVLPSDFHNSILLDASEAEKYNVPFRLYRFLGAELEAPGKMSFTSTVPLAVPSLFQSSSPLMPFNAEKNTVPFTSVMLAGAAAPV